jgi:hypothetical protein
VKVPSRRLLLQEFVKKQKNMQTRKREMGAAAKGARRMMGKLREIPGIAEVLLFG